MSIRCRVFGSSETTSFGFIGCKSLLELKMGNKNAIFAIYKDFNVFTCLVVYSLLMLLSTKNPWLLPMFRRLM
jgi:hypothetical protein